MFRQCFLVSSVLWVLILTSAVAMEENGMEQAIRADYEAGKLDGLHSVLVIHHGEPLAEFHVDGADERWGASLGVREHGPDTLHDLRSVTKSITSLLYGIALDRGLVPPTSAPIVDQFPEYPDLAEEEERRKITIKDALSMKMGLAWNEELPYSDPKNSEVAMEYAPDRYRYALEQSIVAEPGSQWIYSGGATALVARIIEKGAGKPLDEFAKEALFDPLGIDDFDWVGGMDGVPVAASGLRLNIHDLVLIGEMVRQGGEWKGKRIVSEAWLRESIEPQATLQTGFRYGYFWWLSGAGDPPISLSALGNGGQQLYIGRDNGLMLAVLAGRYNDFNAWKIGVRILLNHALPGIVINLPPFED